MSYILPTLLAFVLHLCIAMAFFVSPFSELKQSREMPRHIQAQMFDLKTLTTATEQKPPKAEDKKLDKENKPKPKQPEPEQKPQPKEEIEKPEPEPKVDEQQLAREKQKKERAERRKLEKEKLEKALKEKELKAKEQREIESKRKLAAEKKAKEEAEKKEQQRKEKEKQKKAREEQAKKKAAKEKKDREKALAKKKQQEKKRREEEKRRIAALQKQIAEEEQFAAEQIAKEMASGVDNYIKRILKSNFRIPSTARNGIKALVRIKLLPTGRVVGVELIESSGNAAFDRAAEQAVWRSESFPRVAEIASASPQYFNRELRTFVIKFNPEDLRW